MAGVLTLVTLKVTLLRRSMTGSRGAWMMAGAVVGTCLALSTIALSALYHASPARALRRRRRCVVSGDDRQRPV